MAHPDCILTIDAGNTQLKTGYFADDELMEVRRFYSSQLTELADYVQELKVGSVACSSVLSEEQNMNLKEHMPVPVIFLGSGDKLPIHNTYETPKSLGFDRLCNAVAVAEKIAKGYGLSIDIGTCVKFDLVHTEQGYLGGSISPGIDLRYKSLHDYTANLPLLKERFSQGLTGTSTEKAISSGVINGMHAEILKMIEWYEEVYSDLTIFVTGGDAQYFDFTSKNNIFADENLTLRGLYAVYKTTF